LTVRFFTLRILCITPCTESLVIVSHVEVLTMIYAHLCSIFFVFVNVTYH
jgi:hypothetical protein